MNMLTELILRAATGHKVDIILSYRYWDKGEEHLPFLNIKERRSDILEFDLLQLPDIIKWIVNFRGS